MKYFNAIILSFLFLFSTSVSSQQLTDSAKVSILTCDPGRALYAAFGHTAIRICDPQLGIDLAYNYGMFDFETEYFYGKFISGATDYELGIDYTMFFKYRYEDRKIGVREQVLNMSLLEKQHLFEALIINYRPENRKYRYNFVYDNCATRPRDMIEESLHGDIFYQNDSTSGETFRHSIERYVGKNTWTKFGIDLLIGAESDQEASARNIMYLPQELEKALSTATRQDGSPVVVESSQMLPSFSIDLSPQQPEPLYAMCFVLLFVVICSIFFPRFAQCFDVVLFFVVGILGSVVFFLTFFSFHPLVGENYNLLWLNPLYLLMLIFLPFRFKKLNNLFYVALLITNLVAISGYLFLPQCFNIAFLPLMVALFIRVILRLKNNFLPFK